MFDIKQIQDLLYVSCFFVPGIIILFTRAQFITGRLQNFNENAFSYLIITLIYYGFTFPFIEYALSIKDPKLIRVVLWLCIVIFLPFIFGITIGIFAQKGIFRLFIQKIGINPVHPSPTAWDWWFSRHHERWVIITLKDETKFGGYFGRNSFASSDPKERDLFIEKIYVIEDDNTWTESGNKGLLVSQQEIRTMEFLPVTSEEHINEQPS